MSVDIDVKLTAEEYEALTAPERPKGSVRGPRPTPPVQTARKKRLKRAKLARKANR